MFVVYYNSKPANPPVVGNGGGGGGSGAGPGWASGPVLNPSQSQDETKGKGGSFDARNGTVLPGDRCVCVCVCMMHFGGGGGGGDIVTWSVVVAVVFIVYM